MKNPDDGDDGAHKFDVSGLCSDDDCSSNSDLRQSDHSLACQAQIPKRYTTHLNENLSGDAPSASDNIQTRVTGLGHGTTSHVPILNQIPKALTGSSQSSPAPSSPNERVGPRTAFAQDVLADSGSRKPEPVRSPEIVTKVRSCILFQAIFSRQHRTEATERRMGIKPEERLATRQILLPQGARTSSMFHLQKRNRSRLRHIQKESLLGVNVAGLWLWWLRSAS